MFGWAGALCLAALAFFLRRWHLGTPHAFSFDETYYAKDAWSLLNHGYVRGYVEDADKTILNGNLTGLWLDGPSMIVHPEVGKWVIAAGIKVFGMDPTGWRTASAVVGALMVLLMCRFARRVTGSTVLGLVAGLLLSVDGLQLVLSRLALLDIFLAFFTLCGVHCVVADRQWLRDRLAAGATRTWWRPWLVLGGISFGLACGTKWSAVYALAVFGLLAWLWSAGARRAFGQPRPLLRSIVLDGAPAFVALVGVALATYVASWTGWLVHADAYEDAFNNTQYTSYGGGKPWPTASEPDADGLGEVTQSLRSLWSYHQDVYTFHSHFLNDSTHVYASKPSTWLVMGRPVGRRRPDRHPARLAGVRGTLGLELHPAGPAPRQPGHLVGRQPGRGGLAAAVDRGARLAPRRRGRRPRQHVAPLVRLRRPADLLLLRDHRPAVPRAVGRAGHGPPDRDVRRADAAAHLRRRRRRQLHGARGDRVRVVLADLDRRPADEVGVGRPHLVPALDLTPRGPRRHPIR